MPRNNPARFVVPFRTKIALIIFGFFLFLVLLEAGLRLGGFILLSVQEYGNRQSLKQKGAYRIMCLGESTTQGQYPPYLEKILNQRHTGMRFSVIDKGVAGTNSARILARLESNLAQCHPDMVVAMIGINDEEPQIPYEVAPIPTPKIMLFFESFRTYKLTRLLWLRILAKAKEIKSYMPNQNKERPRKIPAHLGGAGLKGAHTKQPSPASTEDAFKKAIELNPQSDRAYVGLGRLYRDQGKLSQAEDVFKKAIELNPKNVDAHIELGWAYRDQRKLSQAEGAFKKAIELNPRSDRAYAGLGRLYRDQGKLSQAKDALEKAIELNPRGESDRVYIQL
jgi:tetratricopeptide (TPR) repeat protein